MALFLSAAMVLSGLPSQALAEAVEQTAPPSSAELPLVGRDATISGTWGSCNWSITNGVLIVNAGKGSDTGGVSPWSDYARNIREVRFVSDGDEKVVLPEDSSYLFNEMNYLEVANVKEADTSQVRMMACMFKNCEWLESIDLSSWDVHSVWRMYEMFSGCTMLTSTGIEHWNVSSLYDASKMFANCTRLTTLNLNSWDTSSLGITQEMFYRSGIEFLAISNWNTFNLTDATSMFDECGNLRWLDVSGWDARSLQNMYSMFRKCSSLSSIDLSNWDTFHVERMAEAFSGCSSLRTITVGDGWNTSNVTFGNDMFYGCVKLRGGNGTAYDELNTGLDYAHVDLPDSPGYLTREGQAGFEPSFKTANLTIGDQIGLTFWLEAPDLEQFDYSNAYVTLSVDDKDKRVLTTSLNECILLDTKGRYGFKIDLTSVEMAEPVTATFHYLDDGADKTVELTCSVEDYLKTVDMQGSLPDRALALVHATANLGHYMQPYLSYENGWSLNRDYQEMFTDYGQDTDSAILKLSEYPLFGYDNGDGIKSLGCNVSFGSLTTVNFYITPKDPNAEVKASTTYGGRTFEAKKQADGRWLLSIEGIKPYDYAADLIVDGTAPSEFRFYVAPLAIFNVMAAQGNDQARNDALASAYYLWKAADDFQG